MNQDIETARIKDAIAKVNQEKLIDLLQNYASQENKNTAYYLVRELITLALVETDKLSFFSGHGLEYLEDSLRGVLTGYDSYSWIQLVAGFFNNEECLRNFFYDNSVNIKNQFGVIVTALNKIEVPSVMNKRQADIISLSDEDFELIDIDPETINDDTFEIIVDLLQEDLNEGFTEKLWLAYLSSKS